MELQEPASVDVQGLATDFAGAVVETPMDEEANIILRLVGIKAKNGNSSPLTMMGRQQQSVSSVPRRNASSNGQPTKS